jgi:hypothetical protein
MKHITLPLFITGKEFIKKVKYEMSNLTDLFFMKSRNTYFDQPATQQVTSLFQNQRVSIPFFQKAPIQPKLSVAQNNIVQRVPIGGAALAATPAQSSQLPVTIVQQWQAQVSAGNLLQAANVVVAEMIRRGEIDISWYHVQQTTSGSSACMAANPQLITLDNSINGANTAQCTCFTPVTGTIRQANPRVRIHPDLVQYTSIGSTNPQTNATVLHSTLLHEFRHVRQNYEACNTRGTVISSGVCTDCNSPEEMDAYMAQIEAGYHNSEIMNGWVRVFVNWNYLSAAQQAIFAARKQAAQQKVNQLFPGVTWNTNARVQAYQSWCQSLPGNGSPGLCNSFLTNTGPPGSAVPPAISTKNK